MTTPPAPLDASELAPTLAALDAGGDFKSALEDLLRRIPLERAELLMLLMREGRGAWHLLLEVRGGKALFIGNAFSGTVQALAACGFEVTVMDRSPERLAFCAHRTRQWTAGEARTIVSDDAARLPFDDDAFELVVQEEGAPSSSHDRVHSLTECRRVARHEFVLVADNRLGYKRSSGWRGRFEVPSPPRWLLDAMRAPRGERSLRGWRRAMQFDACDRAEAWSLYPTSLDFTFVAGIDRDRPQLYVGPKERENPLKLFGQRIGLFGMLSPSFALRSRSAKREIVPRRIEHILEQLADHIGEAPGEVDQLVATRGNSAVVFTRGKEAAGGSGDWCLHIPLSRQQRVQIERHHIVLERLPKEHPGFPAPRALFRGEVAGLWLTVERRLPGLGAPQLVGQPTELARLLRETAQRATELVVSPAETFSAERFEQRIASRFALVRRFVSDRAVERALDRMLALCRERLIGASIPLVLHHADLRSKHLQVTPDGGLIGVLDWGSSTDRDLPYFDLLHLVVHERKQADDLTPAAAWRLLTTPGGLADAEREPLAHYARTLGLAPEVCEALEQAYPVFVAAMAESNWDYSRPRWLERMFRIASS